MTSIYLDVCCLNRPFDDQTQDRIRLETAAVVAILRHIELEEWVCINSEVIQLEIDSDPNQDRRSRVQELLALAKRIVFIEPEQYVRATELQGLGFGPFDALHLACAEYAQADVFLTTDDRLLHLAIRLGEKLTVRTANPVTWLLEKQHD